MCVQRGAPQEWTDYIVSYLKLRDQSRNRVRMTRPHTSVGKDVCAPTGFVSSLKSF